MEEEYLFSLAWLLHVLHCFLHMGSNFNLTGERESEGINPASHELKILPLNTEIW